MNLLDQWAFGQICTSDWKGQPRTEKGRFDFGKLRATEKTKGNRTQRNGKIPEEEKRLVSSEILTWHPEYKAGESHTHRWRGMFYAFDVIEPGTYKFVHWLPIVGNEKLIERMEARHGKK